MRVDIILPLIFGVIITGVDATRYGSLLQPVNTQERNDQQESAIRVKSNTIRPLLQPFTGNIFDTHNGHTTTTSYSQITPKPQQSFSPDKSSSSSSGGKSSSSLKPVDNNIDKKEDPVFVPLKGSPNGGAESQNTPDLFNSVPIINQNTGSSSSSSIKEPIGSSFGLVPASGSRPVSSVTSGSASNGVVEQSKEVGLSGSSQGGLLNAVVKPNQQPRSTAAPAKQVDYKENTSDSHNLNNLLLLGGLICASLQKIVNTAL